MASCDSVAALFGRRNIKEGCEDPCVLGDESIMSMKAHGTSETPVQDPLRWGCDVSVADRIANFNRRYAERSGYWVRTSFLAETTAEGIPSEENPITFFDSNSGKPIFRAPIGRTWQEFVRESRSHGWPSFRDQEVVWDNVRVLVNGETVSVDGKTVVRPSDASSIIVSLKLVLVWALSFSSGLIPTGTHLGHNLPDGQGNRFCINLVSIAGNPEADDGR